MGDEGGDPEACKTAGLGNGLREIQKKTFTKWLNAQLERATESR